MSRSPSSRAAGSFLGAVAALATGTVAAQGLSYAARPILTRLYTPEAFGLLSFYLGVIAVLNTASTLRYEDAIVLPDDDDDGRALLRLSGALLLAFSLASCAFWPARHALAYRAGLPEMAAYAAWVPLGVLALGASRLAEGWLTRRQRFGSIARSRLVQSSSAAVLQLGGGLQALGAGALMAGTVAGWTAATAFLAGRAWHRKTSPPPVRPDAARLRAVAARYRRFPLYALPATLLNTLSNQVPAFLLTLYFDATVLGLYALAYGVISVPMSVLGSSVGQVFSVRAVEARRSGHLGALTEAVAGQQMLFGCFPILLVVLEAPDVFAFVFGAVWREAGVFAQYVAPWSFFVFAASPLTRLFDVLERQREELAFNAVLFAGRAAALVGGAVGYGQARAAIGLFSACGAVLWGGLLVALLRMGGASLGAVARRLAWSAVLSLPALGVWAAGQGLALPWRVLADALALGAYGLTVLFWMRRRAAPRP